MEKRGQFALEYLLTHAWSIFIVIVILGFLGFYFFNYSSYANKIADSINSIKSSSISGLVLLSQDIIEIPSQVEQNSYLQVAINPGPKGIYKFAYIYDKQDKLIETFSFDCGDICKDKTTASIVANFSLGSYYAAVFSYDEDKYIRKDFEVVSELQEECILKRAYWEKENASKNEQVRLYLESENCEGKNASFLIYRKGFLSNELVENISAIITSEKTSVSWNAKWENSALILWLYKKNPVYYFRVKVNPEITSNELSVSDIVETKLEEKDEGWYSWGKDLDNSRIADYDLTPPFRIKWMKPAPNPNLINPTFLSRDSRVFSLTPKSGGGRQTKFVYNSTTGEFLWSGGDSRTATGTRQTILAKEYILTTNSHWVDSGNEIETGLSAPIIVNYDVSNYDPSNSVIVTQGWCGLDGAGECFQVSKFSGYAGAHPVLNGKINGAYKFDKIRAHTSYYGMETVSFEYIDLGEREKPYNRTDLRTKLNPENNNWTVMLWYKWDGNLETYHPYDYLFSKGLSPYGGYSGTYVARLRNGTLEYRLGPGWDYIKLNESDYYCAPNEWCHLTLIFDHKYEKIYKNGNLVFKRAALHRAKSIYYYKEKMKQELLNRTSGDSELTNIINSINITSGYGDDFLNAVLAEAVNQGAGDKMLALVSDMEYDIGGNTESLSIGGFGPGYWVYGFSGLIDEFAIFNRALPEEEIKEKMNSESIPDSSTQLLLHFNNDSAYSENENFVKDFSSNNYNGVPIYHSYATTLWGTSYERGGGGCWSGMPAIHDNFVYRTNGILYAHDTRNGSIIWKSGINNQIIKERYGKGEQPVRLGEILHDCTQIVYLDGIIYTSAMEAINYTLVNIYGQVIGNTINLKKPVFLAYNATTGQEIVRIDLNKTFGQASPLDFAVENKIAYMIGLTGYGYVKLSAINILTNEEIWTYNVSNPTIGVQSMVLSGNLLFISAGNSIIAFNKHTGEEVWQFKSPYDVRYGFSGLIIDNNMLFVASSDGKIFAFEQGYEKPRILNNETKLPAGQVGRAYSVRPAFYSLSNLNYTFSHINGEMPFNWEIISGKLPTGLSLNNDKDNYNAILSGTPTESGDFTFKVRVSDKRGNYDEKEFLLRILPESKEFSLDLQNNENYSGCEDSLIDGYAPNTNYGNRSTSTGSYNGGITEAYSKRGLMKFKIFQKEGGLVPDDAILTGASLTLFKLDNSNHIVSAYKLLRNWSEMEATWNQARKGENWSIPGANETGIDRTEKLLNFTTIKMFYFTAYYGNGSYTFDISPLIIGYDLGEENNGWIFEQPYQSSLVFYSCDYKNETTNDTSLSPKLTIRYKRFSPENKPPVVKMYANPSIVLVQGFYSRPVIFDASQSYDSNGEILGYNWSYALPTSPSQKFPIQCINYNLSTPWLCNYSFYYLPGWYDKYIVFLEIYDNYGAIGITLTNITLVRNFSSTTITTTMLRDGRVNQSYSDYVYVEGNSSKPVWNIVRGNLPLGLTLEAGTGKISGIPTTTGKYDFTIGVTGSYVEQNLSIEILNESGEIETCSDGTAYNSCSVNKPKYCLNGILIENCSLCSCSSGNCLTNGSCEIAYINEDVVQDKNIDIKDLIKIGVNFGRTDCSSGNNYCERADVNRDGRIDVQDLIRVGLKFGYGY